MTSTLFGITRRLIIASLILQVLAAFFYPGGTVRDPAPTRFSLSANFISDLGMTRSHGGRPNGTGAALFAAGFATFAVALICCGIGFVRLHARSARGRPLAFAGAGGTSLAGVCLLAAGLSPANVGPAVHMWSATMASAIAPPSLVLLAIAAARDARLPPGVWIAWLILAVTVGAWFAMRWPSAGSNQAALIAHVSAQKLVAAVVVGVVTYQTYRGDEINRAVDGPAEV